MTVSSVVRLWQGTGVRPVAARPARLAGFVTVFVVASVAIPFVAHQFGVVAGRTFLPMHFFALMAGMVFGWRAGLLVGAGSPIVSYLVSGMPFAASLPVLVPEIAAYGLIAGLLQARRKSNLWVSLVGAMIGGRLVLLLAAAMALPQPALGYICAALVTGLPGVAVQLIVIPPAARRLCSWLSDRQ